MSDEVMARRLEAIRAPEDLAAGFAGVGRRDRPILTRVGASWGNDVYEATFEDGTRRFVRVTREGRQGFDREAWAISRFRELDIPAPEIIAIVEQKRNGVVWSGCVLSAAPGETLSELRIRNEISDWDYLRISHEVGTFAARIHAVPAKGWGLLDKKGAGSAKRDDYLMPYPLDELLRAAAGSSIPEEKLVRGYEVVTDELVLKMQRLPSLVHGDLAPKHVIVHGGRVSALIDVELVQGGDPMVDLAFWSYFEDVPGSTDALLLGYGADGALRRRVVLGRIWTSLMFVGSYGASGDLSDQFAAKIAERLELDLAETAQ